MDEHEFDALQLRPFVREAVSDPRRPSLRSVARSSATIWAGGQRFTTWEARCEVVRRAIEYLENS